ncbi:hypothetical protein ANO11243_036670 [Dothideomycetidae sp. 11243]|nr:hypothetical protein ANO11243_036670 [fungal sp. No.11243]
MSSAVFFKFKSQKEPQRVTFDGTGISVFELKRDIISISRLGDGTDFDLAISNPDNNEEYDDDTVIVSRGTTVVARRLPASKPGAGRAARYVSGKMPVTAKNQHRIESTKSASIIKDAKSTPVNLSTNATEEDRIAAMFNQGGEQWEQQQAQMANQKAIHRTGYVKPQAVPDKPLPAGYTCHRCGEKGHWIQACPTNSDPTFDNRPKFKKTTGIPRSFLKVIDKPPVLASDGSVDVSQLPAGVMYTANGDWVVAEPDKASWDQFQAKAKASAEKAEASAGNQEIKEWGLECPIDKRMFVDPVKTPCCGQTYCRECIENALLSSDFVCPGCSTDGVLVDNLIEDEDATKKIKEFAEASARERDSKAKSASPALETVEPAATPTKTIAEPQPAGTPNKETKSPSVKPASPTTDRAVAVVAPKSPTTSTSSRKRAADDELENKRIPTAPAAMRNRQNQQMQQQGMNNDFANQMNMMAASMGQNGQAMNFMNPMAFPGMMNNMMGMPDPMMMMGGMGGMGGMGFPAGNMMNNGNMGFNQQWQGNGQNWGNGMGNSMGGWQNQYQGQHAMGPQQQQQHQHQHQQNTNGGPYMRQPINPGRHQNRNRNQQQRSVDYRELGS